MEPIDILPECFLNEKDIKRLDAIFDRAAANSRWSNEDVARAICRVLHLICGDGNGNKKFQNTNQRGL